MQAVSLIAQPFYPWNITRYPMNSGLSGSRVGLGGFRVEKENLLLLLGFANSGLSSLYVVAIPTTLSQ